MLRESSGRAGQARETIAEMGPAAALSQAIFARRGARVGQKLFGGLRSVCYLLGVWWCEPLFGEALSHEGLRGAKHAPGRVVTPRGNRSNDVMEGQRQRSGGGRRRRRKARAEARVNAEPAVIVARRPNSPLIVNGNGKPTVAASAAPQTKASNGAHDASPAEPAAARPVPAPPKRSARIVQLPSDPADDAEKQRQRLLARLMASDGRGAISRAASEYQNAGFAFPEEQDVQLQLLESFDEEQAREAVRVLARLLAREPPIKRPVLEQRLRRLEEYGDEAQTRETAAELRRTLRA
jgi:hypothetical protein